MSPDWISWDSCICYLSYNTFVFVSYRIRSVSSGKVTHRILVLLLIFKKTSTVHFESKTILKVKR